MSRRAVDKFKIWMEFENLIRFGDVTPPDIFEFEDEEDGKCEKIDDKKSLNNFRKWLAKRNADELNQQNEIGETMLMVALDYEKFTIAAELNNAGGNFNKNGEESFWRSFRDGDRVRRVQLGFNAELKEIRKKSAEEVAKAAAPRLVKHPKFVEPKKKEEVVDPEELRERWCAMMGIVPAAAPTIVPDVSVSGVALASRDDGAKK